MEVINDTPVEPGTPGELTPEQRYAQLCTQLGHRQYLVARLTGEINLILEEISKLPIPENQGHVPKS